MLTAKLSHIWNFNENEIEDMLKMKPYLLSAQSNVLDNVEQAF